ncbi:MULTISPECIES: RDD family protein [unclassified Empedobacter]|uniref:RDD family protein n=1 Tax=unclassified Empedobacter TaxID=2643773 RepID=UPI0025B9B831|nr:MULTISPECIES: RDD family protein [unclassified Empedobacter]
MYQDYKVGEHKTNQGLRLANYLIDGIVYLICTFIIGLILGVVAVMMNFQLPESNLIYNIIAAIVLVFYYFLIESITKGRSLGKFITGTKVVMIDGSTPTTKDYFTRSICRIIPFDVLTFLGENGWHDKISKTTVVNKKAFEADLSQADNIESIGKTEFE